MAEAFDLPDEQDETDEHEQDEALDLAMLDALAMTIAEKRREAISGRAQCGIEQEWAEDQEFYEGIDDANRGESGGYRSKPPGQIGLGDEGEEGDDSTSSTVFPNITRPYVDAAAARVGDMLLPTDDRAWQIKPTPVPELMDLAESLPTKTERDEISKRYDNEAQGPERANAVMKDEADLIKSKLPKDIQGQVESEAMNTFGEGSPAYQGEEDYQMRLQKTYLDLADSITADMEVATKGAKNAERRIDDWHTECQYHTHMRDVIEGTSRLGTGVAKGPIPVKKQHMAFKNGKIIIEEVIKPVTLCVNVRNCYPDPGCGESVHNGAYHFERDDITSKTLMQLRGQPNYHTEMIDLVLEEGPYKVTREVAETDGVDGMIGLIRRDKKNLYEIWYGYVHITRTEAEEAGIEIPEEMGNYPLIPVDVTMVNNHIIKIVMNHLDTGEYPYDYMVWQKRAGLPYGIGVARQLRTPQRILTAALRNLMDNAGLAGGPMWAYLEGVMEPIDGVPELRPRKGWMINLDMVNDPRMIEYALRYIDMPMKTQDLQSIIDMALRMAEDVTGLPSLMQGNQGSAPDTVGGMTILNNNASTVLRRIARLFDDKVTEPHVRRYYTYLLQYGEEDGEKAEFVIDARGSSALVERDINNDAIQQMGGMVTNPIFGMDPQKWFIEWLKSNRLDPNRFKYDDQEWKETVEKLVASSQKPDSAVEVAQIRAESAAQVQDSKNQIEEARLALSNEKDNRDSDFKEAKQLMDQELAIAFRTLDKEIEDATTSAKEREIMQKIRGDLAEAAMKIEAQFKMQQAGQGGEIATPPIEPAGRAPDGQSYAK